MRKKVAVGDIMTRNLVTIKPNATLQDCARKMVKERVNTILVTESKKLKGILTARDILWAQIKKRSTNLNDVKIIDVATKKVAVIKPSADIQQAFQKMKRYNFRRLPVLSKGEVVGILTISDILRVDPSIYTELGTISGIREEAKKMKKIGEVESWNSEGNCHECGEYAPLLKVEGRLLCPFCRDELF